MDRISIISCPSGKSTLLREAYESLDLRIVGFLPENSKEACCRDTSSLDRGNGFTVDTLSESLLAL